jgi:hypothetical protein
MDRDVFIRECVRALEGLAVGNSGRNDADKADDAPAALYDRLTFDFPDLSAGDLARILEWVCGALRRGDDRNSLGSRAADEQLHPVLGLVLGVRAGPAWESSRGGTRDPESALATVLDTLEEKSQSSSPAEDVTLWQQLYGAHVFGLLAYGPDGLVEGLLEASEGSISYHGLARESTWMGGTFVSVTRDVLHGIVHETGLPGVNGVAVSTGRLRRSEAAFGVLEAVVLGTRSSAIATAVFEMLLDVCGLEGPSSVGTRGARVRVARMVAAACLADGRLVRLEMAKRALFELVEPVLGQLSGSRREEGEERSMVLMAGGVLLEHVVQEQMRCAGSKSSAQQGFEEEMIRRGLWGLLVSSMASGTGLAPKGDRGAAARMSLARALMMASAYSPKLHAWAIRVPAYAAAWAPPDSNTNDGDDDNNDVDAAVLRAAWSALSMCVDEETPRHVRFLGEVLSGRTPDELTQSLSTLEMTDRLCRAFEVQDGSQYTDNPDTLATVERMEGIRAVVRERIVAAERARVVDENKPRRLSTLPEVERLRHIDRILKGLCAMACVTGTDGKAD